MNRLWIAIGAGVAVAALLLVILFGVRYARRLEEQISQLERKTENLSAEVAAAERSALEAEARAEQARAEAEVSREQAAAAQTRARGAEQQALGAAEARRLAEMAEAEAERARQAAQAESAEAEAEAARAREEAERAAAAAAELRRERERDLDRLQAALEQIAETRRTALGLVMNLGSDRVEFDFDRAELRPENRELLSRIAGVLLTADDFQIQVFGHTDDVGTEEYNQGLSERRAGAVREYLIEAGLPAEIITTQGFGKTRPIASGTDEESRQRNRRVEIAVIQSIEDFRPLER